MNYGLPAGHVEGPRGAPICDGSGVYVGTEVGWRDLCVDCGKRVKVVAGHYLANHRAHERLVGQQ